MNSELLVIFGLLIVKFLKTSTSNIIIETN